MDKKQGFVLPDYTVKKTGLAKIKNKKLQRQKLNIDIKNFLRKGHKIKVLSTQKFRNKMFPCFPNNE